MTPLNDDELSALLEQAKSKLLEPRPGLTARALRNYQSNVARRQNWRWLRARPVTIPLPLGILAAGFLMFIGAAVGYSFRRAPTVAQTHSVKATVEQERNPQAAGLTFMEFQPVSEIRPRTVRSFRNDR